MSFCEEIDWRYIVKELTKEMEHKMKNMHERLDRIERSWKRATQNSHHPTRRTWRIQDDKWGEIENIISHILTTQSPNKKEMVTGFDSSADTDNEESDSKMPESNVSCEDVHQVSNAITDDEGEAEEVEILSEKKPNDEKIDAPEEIEVPDELVLVSRQDLNVQIHIGDEEQQQNTLHTKSIIEDEVCGMIIDGETCTNEARSIMVEIVGFHVLNHPKSYKLQWLHKSVKVRVDMQGKFPNNIDEYEDYVNLQEESVPKKKKKKKLKGRDIMQWSSLARIAGFVFDPGIDDTDLRTILLKRRGIMEIRAAHERSV